MEWYPYADIAPSNSIDETLRRAAELGGIELLERLETVLEGYFFPGSAPEVRIFIPREKRIPAQAGAAWQLFVVAPGDGEPGGPVRIELYLY